MNHCARINLGPHGIRLHHCSHITPLCHPCHPLKFCPHLYPSLYVPGTHDLCQSLQTLSVIKSPQRQPNLQFTGTAIHMPPVLLPQYPGWFAMLHIVHKWITYHVKSSHVKSHISPACWTEPVIVYCMEKYGWSCSTIDHISWRSIKPHGTSVLLQNLYRQANYAQLATGYANAGSHLGLPQCPSCTHRDEILDHIFHCPHPLLQCNWELI